MLIGENNLSSNEEVRLKGFFDKLNTIKFDLDKLKISFTDLSKATSATVSTSITGPSITAHSQNTSVHYNKSSIELEDLQDVEYVSLGNDEIIQYDLPNTRWTNKTPLEAIPELNYYNGTFLEKFHALVTSDGATITLTLTEVNGADDLTMVFSDGHTTLDVSGGGATIALTAGTDANPQTNYVYILQSDKVLAKDTSAWPTAEAIYIGQYVVPSAGFVQTNNVYLNQNWNEGTDATQGQGHYTHQSQRLRQFGAEWFSGIDPAGTSDYLTIAASNVEFKSGSGVVWQIHSHTFGAFDTSTGDIVLVKNWNGDAYHDITDLFDIVADSTGTSLANKWFTLVVWGIGNKEGELDYIVINLPSGSYTTEAKATEDANNYTDFAIPRQYSIESSTGFLICEIVVKQSTTWSYGSTKNLRGLSSAVAVAGAVGTGITDHGSLTGLSDDDHTQYVLKSGSLTQITTRSHTDLSDIGTNTHAQIDTHITNEPAAAIATHALDVDAHHAVADYDADLMIGTGNSAYVPLEYTGDDNTSNLGRSFAGQHENATTSDWKPSFSLLMPTNRGGLTLRVKNLRIQLKVADSTDKIIATRIFAMDHDSLDQKFSHTKDFTAQADIITDGSQLNSLTEFDAGAYRKVAVIINCSNATARELVIAAVELEVYYA